MALRLLAFKQIYKILGMDKLEFNNSNQIKLPKKRQHQNDDSECKFYKNIILQETQRIFSNKKLFDRIYLH